MACKTNLKANVDRVLTTKSNIPVYDTSSSVSGRNGATPTVQVPESALDFSISDDFEEQIDALASKPMLTKSSTNTTKKAPEYSANKHNNLVVEGTLNRILGKPC